MIFNNKYPIEGLPISAHNCIAVDALIMDVDFERDVLIGTSAMKAIS